MQSRARKYFSGVIEFAVRSKPRPQTVAISSATDDFSREAQQGAVQSANDHGIRVIYAEQYAGDPASINAAAAAIAARHPDVVLNAGHVQDTIAMHRALHDRGADAKIYGYSVGPDTPDFRAALGAEAQGVLGGAQWSPAVSYVGDPGFYRTSAEYTAAFTREGRPRARLSFGGIDCGGHRFCRCPHRRGLIAAELRSGRLVPAQCDDIFWAAAFRRARRQYV